MKASLFTLLVFFLNGPVVADSPSVSVKQIGALFLEAPPGREKNLIPMGAFGAQEKVETHAVIIFENRLIADIPTFGDDSKVSAFAILPNKTQVSLGTASTSSFRKISEDGKKTLVSISVSRLPDSFVSGVLFKGFIKLPVASAIKRNSAAFQPKVGKGIDVGLGNILISKIESDSMTLSGDDRLTRVATIKIIKTDGTIIVGERGGYSRRGGTEGTVVESQWRFNSPIIPGKIEVATYNDLAIIEVPINLMVTKPY
ncbi:hypothetical protein [Sulfurirhabdus autotrophica]|uniref:Uncharacterized protein n=1 Tax=Sulfurirhabdus autotrophica TaxID=1706046 RepID=A0A4R3XXH9_9PROT|nr:hypothetical protein [Sulfurirhabdus autotrophica]TCV82968.1 hypothetical protein EDC63_1171 [Sulfurirhabdus autotrophica]